MVYCEEIKMKIEFVGGWRYLTVCAILGAIVWLIVRDYVISMF